MKKEALEISLKESETPFGLKLSSHPSSKKKLKCFSGWLEKKIRDMIREKEYWYPEFLEMGIEERKEAVIYLLNWSNKLKREQIKKIKKQYKLKNKGFFLKEKVKIIKTKTVEQLFKDMFGETQKDLSLLLYRNHLHFLVKKETYPRLMGEGIIGKLMDKKDFKKEFQEYAGLVSLGYFEEGWKETADHERYHGMTCFFPVKEYLRRLWKNLDRLSKEGNKRNVYKRRDQRYLSLLRNFLCGTTYEELKAWYSCLEEPKKIKEKLEDHQMISDKQAIFYLRPEAFKKSYTAIISKEEIEETTGQRKKMVEEGVVLLDKLKKEVPKKKIQLAMELCLYSEFPERLEEYLKVV